MISLERIEEALSFIDPVFLDTPQFRSDGLSKTLGMHLIVKVECLNPIRSFKGRGACYYTHRHRDTTPRPWICASAGNFGQGLAYAASPHSIPLIVFASRNANPYKLERMRALGAEVRLIGEDFDAAKDASRRYAEDHRATFVEDGRDAAITEGAGTLALELARFPDPLDVVLVPLGNGALVNGIGAYMKARQPQVRVIGTGTERAPAMERSFRQRRAVTLTDPVETIADGVATRVAVPEAVELMLEVVDDVLLVEEQQIVHAMEAIRRELGLVVEGAGAVSLAAATAYRDRFQNERVAVVITGSNVTHST